MRWSHGRVTLAILAGIVLLAVCLGILFGTDLILHAHPVPFPLIAGGAALLCVFVLRLRGGGRDDGGPSGTGRPF